MGGIRAQAPIKCSPGELGALRLEAASSQSIPRFISCQRKECGVGAVLRRLRRAPAFRGFCGRPRSGPRARLRPAPCRGGCKPNRELRNQTEPFRLCFLKKKQGFSPTEIPSQLCRPLGRVRHLLFHSLTRSRDAGRSLTRDAGRSLTPTPGTAHHTTTLSPMGIPSAPKQGALAPGDAPRTAQELGGDADTFQLLGRGHPWRDLHRGRSLWCFRP